MVRIWPSSPIVRVNESPVANRCDGLIACCPLEESNLPQPVKSRLLYR